MFQQGFRKCLKGLEQFVFGFLGDGGGFEKILDKEMGKI